MSESGFGVFFLFHILITQASLLSILETCSCNGRPLSPLTEHRFGEMSLNVRVEGTNDCNVNNYSSYRSWRSQRCSTDCVRANRVLQFVSQTCVYKGLFGFSSALFSAFVSVEESGAFLPAAAAQSVSSSGRHGSRLISQRTASQPEFNLSCLHREHFEL